MVHCALLHGVSMYLRTPSTSCAPSEWPHWVMRVLVAEGSPCALECTSYQDLSSTYTCSNMDLGCAACWGFGGQNHSKFVGVKSFCDLCDDFGSACRTPEEMRWKLSVQFHGEEGIDAGGVSREWYQVCSHLQGSWMPYHVPQPGPSDMQPDIKGDAAHGKPQIHLITCTPWLVRGDPMVEPWGLGCHAMRR